MGNGWAKAYDDEFKQDHSKDANRYVFNGFAEPMKKRCPEITILNKLGMGEQYIFKMGQESEIIDRSIWEKLITQLKIRTVDEMFSRLPEVCEWFITQSQYVEFEEVKNGS